MTNKNPDHGPEGHDEVQPDATQGSEAHASGPGAQGGDFASDDFTIDDILSAEQTAEASAHETEDEAIAERNPQLSDAAAEHLDDLKRLTAEYANYRRRTEEQRGIEIERAKGEAARNLLPVLDDLDRAAKHGDLEQGSPFANIAEKVRLVAEKMGLEQYGAAGETFDPQRHEAIFQAPTPGVTEPTILEVVEIGYMLGAVELRPAKVVVAVPAE